METVTSSLLGTTTFDQMIKYYSVEIILILIARIGNDVYQTVLAKMSTKDISR